MAKKTVIAFQPAANYILVRRGQSLTKSAGGILIPDESQEAPHEGEVLAVGKTCRGVYGNEYPMPVTVGETIVFRRNSGIETRIAGEVLLLVRENDLLGTKPTL